MSKISKAVDQTPSSVTSTPRTPRIDLASRLAGKTKKEKEKKEKVKCKNKQCSLFLVSPCRKYRRDVVVRVLLSVRPQPRRRRRQ